MSDQWSRHREVREMIQLQSQGTISNDGEESDDCSSEEDNGDNDQSSLSDSNDDQPMIMAVDTKFTALMNLSDDGD